MSWFNARAVLPLPPDGQPATYLLGGSAPSQGITAAYLTETGAFRDRVAAPDGGTALEVIELPAARETGSYPAALSAPILLTDMLTLTGAEVSANPDGATVLRLLWHAEGSEPDNWRGYRVEIAGDDWAAESSLDAFRPTEWIPGGFFITTHPLDADATHTGLRLRLIRVDNSTPVTSVSAPDGWRPLSEIMAQ